VTAATQGVGAAAAKWVAVLVVTGLSLVGATAVSRRDAPLVSHPPSAASAAGTSPLAPASTGPLEATASGAIAAPGDASPELAAAKITPPRSASSAAPRRVLPGESSSDLGEELRLLERARSRLRGGDAAGALATIEQYRRRTISGGALGPEADVLEVESLVELGRRDEAARKARALSRRDPGGPLSERLRGLLGE